MENNRQQKLALQFQPHGKRDIAFQEEDGGNSII